MEEKWLSPQFLVLVTSLVTLALYFVNIMLTNGAPHNDLCHRTCMLTFTMLFLLLLSLAFFDDIHIKTNSQNQGFCFKNGSSVLFWIKRIIETEFQE